MLNEKEKSMLQDIINKDLSYKEKIFLDDIIENDNLSLNETINIIWKELILIVSMENIMYN